VALAGDPAFVWTTGLLKVGAGLVALALVRPWGRHLPRRALRTAAWLGGALLLLYGGASWIQHGLMEAGVVDTPETLGEEAVRWHLLLWDPWWVLGGALFLSAGLRARSDEFRHAVRSVPPND
jgi:hypothetical protein